MLAVIDIETTGLSRYNDDITWFGVLLEDGRYQLKQDPSPDYIRYMHNYLQDHTLIYQNGKFDTLFLEHKFGEHFRIDEDVMLMGTAYDMSDRHGLKYMAKKYLGAEDWDISNKLKTAGGDEVKPYLLKDLQYTMELYLYFKERLRPSEWNIYNHILMPAYRMYRDVEKTGIYIDRDELVKLHDTYRAEADVAYAELLKIADINWNSAIQVRKQLFDVEGLPIIKTTPKGMPSADASSLKQLAAGGSKTAQALLDYKFYSGALSKFLVPWQDYAAYDSRIHPNFNLTNVVTGRTSCSDPNLQQVPRRKDLRGLFTAPEGRVLIEADYSQIELRVAADYAREPTMIKIYRTGGDIHTETAKSVTGKTEITKEDRTKAKAVNFGFLYGMSAKGFLGYAKDSYGVELTLQEAQQYRERFFQTYSRLLPWHMEMADQCEMDGGVANRFGRFRKIPEIYSLDGFDRGSAVRKSVNSPVQGTASDLLIIAATEIHNVLRHMGVDIVGTVHDSILLECDEADVEYVTGMVKSIMSKPSVLGKFGVTFEMPIEADVEVGPWGSK